MIGFFIDFLSIFGRLFGRFFIVFLSILHRLWSIFFFNRGPLYLIRWSFSPESLRASAVAGIAALRRVGSALGPKAPMRVQVHRTVSALTLSLSLLSLSLSALTLTHFL